MKELSIEKMEMVNGGTCGFEDLMVLSTVFFSGLGMYISGQQAAGMVVAGSATLAMFACM
jgi:hypothetical protein